MSRKLAKGCLLLFVLFCRAAIAQDVPKQQVSYESMVERVKGGDKTVDFRQLRLAYMDSTTYSNAPDTDPQKKAMMAALNSKDFAGAIKDADIVLASNFVDMDAHFVEYIAYREQNAPDKAEFHKFVFQALVKSITDSGDGKTPETAFQVILVHEEYVLLRFMGFGMPGEQSLFKKNSHSYDEMKCEDPKSGKPVTFYFNVDIPIKHGI